MKQKLIITRDQDKVNDFIEQGWRVVSITAQHVATGAVYQVDGLFAILLERD